MTREVPGEGRIALFLGPGTRLEALRPILVALSGAAHDVQPIDTLAAFADLEGASGTLLLDADLIAIEDLGWLRRLCAGRPALRLVLVGDDPSRRGARSLLRLAQARWTSWPPDVEDLEAIVGAVRSAPGDSRAGDSVSAGPPTRAQRAPFASGRSSRAPSATVDSAREATASRPASLEDDLDEIETILEMPPGAQRTAPRVRPRGIEPLRDIERPSDIERSSDIERMRVGDYLDLPQRRAVDRTSLSSPSAPTTVPTAYPAESAQPPPKYFRDQVADLADIAQRIELSVDAVESASVREHPPDRSLEGLRGEIARLVQFTRTLGYLVAPPPPGEQVFDLGETIRVIVAGLVARGPESPRYLLREDGTLFVRSDRQLLGQAFDAFFFLVHAASQTGEIVRVQWSLEESSARARIAIEFPAGPLAELSPAQIVEPYGLRRMLPELGPNALSAAIGIVQGQGGSAVLRKTPSGRLEWIVTLPLHLEGREHGTPVVEVARADPSAEARPEDPFA